MLNGEMNRAQLSKSPILSRKDDKIVARKKSFQTEDNNFKKLLAKKKDEKINHSKSEKVDSKASKNTEENQASKAKEKDKAEDIIKDKAINLEEEKDSSAQEELSELEGLIENLIQALQSDDTIDNEKLKALSEKLEEIISQLDINNLKLNGSFDLSKVEEIVQKLQSINIPEIIGDENLRAVIQEKTVRLSQLVKDNDKQVNSLNVESGSGKDTNNSLNIDNSPKLNSDNQNMSNNLSSENKNVSEEGTSTKGAEAKEVEAKGTEVKFSMEGSSKEEGNIALKNPKDLNGKITGNRDMDLAAVKNLQVENNNMELSQINKTLNSSTIKQDLNIFNQVLEGTKASISDDVSEMVIKLKPDNLGKLSMKIVLERGLVIARFDVESQIVKQAIESNLEDLRNALSDKGFEVKEFDVSVNKDSRDQESSFSYLSKRKSKKSLMNMDQTRDEGAIVNSYNINGLNSSFNYLA